MTTGRINQVSTDRRPSSPTNGKRGVAGDLRAPNELTGAAKTTAPQTWCYPLFNQEEGLERLGTQTIQPIAKPFPSKHKAEALRIESKKNVSFTLDTNMSPPARTHPKNFVWAQGKSPRSHSPDRHIKDAPRLASTNGAKVTNRIFEPSPNISCPGSAPELTERSLNHHRYLKTTQFGFPYSNRCGS